ncbi:MAG TPA: hypothetical protein VFA81_02240 [Burkholderiales bacterium]|nr:hypothetical protein [Burkholderiales bacterium]
MVESHGEALELLLGAFMSGFDAREQTHMRFDDRATAALSPQNGWRA